MINVMSKSGVNKAKFDERTVHQSIENLLHKIQQLEQTLAMELHQQRDELLYEIKRGRAIFKQEIKTRNQALRISVLNYVSGARWLVIASAPVIYMLFIPFIFLDLSVSVYQSICFRIYRIPLVKRGDYFVYDRVRLDYLNAIEKINCAYCSYANGVIGYVREVAARTEQYWCPIKHAKSSLNTHSLYPKFTDFGNGEQYRRERDRIKHDF